MLKVVYVLYSAVIISHQNINIVSKKLTDSLTVYIRLISKQFDMANIQKYPQRFYFSLIKAFMY